MFFSPSVVISLTTVIFFTTASCNESFFFDKYQDNKMRFCFVPSKHCSLARHCSTRTSLKENQDILSSTNNPNRSPEIGNVAIVGGGLAGLSTAFHLLQKSASLHRRTPRITIIDKNPPGNGGASSVAGGWVLVFNKYWPTVIIGLSKGIEQRLSFDCFFCILFWFVLITSVLVQIIKIFATLCWVLLISILNTTRWSYDCMIHSLIIYQLVPSCFKSIYSQLILLSFTQQTDYFTHFHQVGKLYTWA